MAVQQEDRTWPGEDPGIYACDYKKLARIQLATARGRLALLRGEHASAEVGQPPRFCGHSQAGRVTTQCPRLDFPGFLITEMLRSMTGRSIPGDVGARICCHLRRGIETLVPCLIYEDWAQAQARAGVKVP